MLEAATITGGSGGITTVELLLALLNVLLGALTGAGVLLRKRYEKEIADRDTRIEKYEDRENKTRENQERLLAATELAMAVANKQNETMNVVVQKQGVVLDEIVGQLSETRLASRRPRAGA